MGEVATGRDRAAAGDIDRTAVAGAAAAAARCENAAGSAACAAEAAHALRKDTVGALAVGDDRAEIGEVDLSAGAAAGAAAAAAADDQTAALSAVTAGAADALREEALSMVAVCGDGLPIMEDGVTALTAAVSVATAAVHTKDGVSVAAVAAIAGLAHGENAVRTRALCHDHTVGVDSDGAAVAAVAAVATDRCDDAVAIAAATAVAASAEPDNADGIDGVDAEGAAGKVGGRHRSRAATSTSLPHKRKAMAIVAVVTAAVSDTPLVPFAGAMLVVKELTLSVLTALALKTAPADTSPVQVVVVATTHCADAIVGPSHALQPASRMTFSVARGAEPLRSCATSNFEGDWPTQRDAERPLSKETARAARWRDLRRADSADRKPSLSNRILRRGGRSRGLATTLVGKARMGGLNN